MSNYTTPNVQILIMDEQDVITTSDQDTIASWDDGWNDKLTGSRSRSVGDF